MEESWTSIALLDAQGRLRWVRALPHQGPIPDDLDRLSFDPFGAPAASARVNSATIADLPIPPSPDRRDEGWSERSRNVLIAFSPQDGAVSDIWHIPFSRTGALRWRDSDLYVASTPWSIARLHYD